jgi:hypothetical protein
MASAQLGSRAMKNLPVILLLALLSLISSCKQKHADEINFGRVDGGNYRNDFFQLDLSIPADWIYEDHRVNTRQVQIAGNRYVNEVVQPSSLNALTLCTLKHPPTGSHLFPPSFLLYAQDLRQNPKVTTGEQFLAIASEELELAEKLDKEQTIKATPEGGIIKGKIAGEDFYRLKVRYDVRDQVFYQEQYCRIIRGYALVVVMTYTSEAEKELELEILQGISFDEGFGTSE